MSTALLALVTRLFQSMMSPRHKRRRLAAGPTLLDLPNDCIYEVLLRVRCPRSLAAVACTCTALAAATADDDRPWAAALDAALPGVAALLDAAPPPWARGAPTARARLAALAGGLPFRAQVFNREADNPAEDFLMSAYDADVVLGDAATAARAPALLPPSLPAARRKAAAAVAGRGRGGATAPPATPPPPRRSGLPRSEDEVATFTATYLPMGGAAAVEAGVTPSRLRAAPAGSAPRADRAAGPLTHADAGPGLDIGDPVEIQWKAAKSHPYGWWLGVVESIHGDAGAPGGDHDAPTFTATIDVTFEHYNEESPWRTVSVPLAAPPPRGGRARVVAAPVNGDPAYGYVGGVRRPRDVDLAAWDASLAALDAAGRTRGRPRPVRALGKA